MTHKASGSMEELPWSFQLHLSNLKVTWAEKLTILVRFERLQMIVFQGHSFNFKVTLAVYKVTRPAVAIKSPKIFLVFNSKRFFISVLSHIVRRCCHANVSWWESSCAYLWGVWFGESEMQVWTVHREMFACDEMHNESILNTLSVSATPRAHLCNALWWTLVILSSVHMIPHCRNFEWFL